MVKSIFTLAMALLLSVAAHAQQIKVHGIVVSATDDEPLIGATVFCEDTKAGVSTDIEGDFTLEVPAGSKLKISYVGYEPEIVAAQPEMRIALRENSEVLNEVVVVGYSTEKKADLTGSVSVVKMKDVSDTPTGNVLQALQGRVAGMNIVTDGTPGGTSTSTSIRGASSFRGDANSPLYVIDGVMTRDNIATIINASDIESIQVLKDASSAAIYGAQAANGVIIITTKRAKKGESHVTFDASLQLQTYNKGLDLLNADEWGNVYWSAFKYANNGATPNSSVYGTGETPKLTTYKNLNGEDVLPQNTDWEDEIHRTALMQTYTIGLTHGSEDGSSSFSLSWLDHDGIVKGTDFQRVNSRISTDYGYLNNRLRVGANATINWWKAHYAPDGVEENAVKQHPAKGVFDVSGEYNDAISDVLGDTPNAMRLIDNNSNNKHQYWRVLGDAYLSIEPFKNLILRTNFGVNFYNETNKVFEPKWLRDVVNKMTQSTVNRTDWVWTNTAQYTNTFGRNYIMGLLGIEAKRYHTEDTYGFGTGLAIEDLNYQYLSSVVAGQTVSAGASNYSMFSVFGKVNYTWDDKYLAQVTLRRDASSRLSSKNNADWFPSFSLGWRLSNEPFMEATRGWLNELKLRGAWGVNGNDIIDNEAFYTKYLISLQASSYNMNGNGSTLTPGAYKIRSTNPDLTWEKTYQTNVGVDFSMLNGRLFGSLDYFYKTTKDMLVEKPYIAIIGEGGYCWYNGGEMTNKGFEAQINWRDRAGELTYNVGFNLTLSKNKVTDLLQDIYYTYGGGNGIDKSLVGQPYGSWMGYRVDGVFHTQAEVDEYLATYKVEYGNPGVGRLRYADTNGDGKINASDRTWLGCDLPKATFGLNLGAEWKGFDLSLFFNAIIRDAYNNAKYYTDFFQLWNGNHSTALLDAAAAYDKFLQTGVYNCDIPAPTTDNSNNENQLNSYFIENGSFLRLKTLTLGYTLPQNLMNKLKLASARVYFQAQNLFTVTNYKGADPEGLGYPYAIPRSFTFGIQFGF